MALPGNTPRTSNRLIRSRTPTSSVSSRTLVHCPPAPAPRGQIPDEDDPCAQRPLRLLTWPVLSWTSCPFHGSRLLTCGPRSTSRSGSSLGFRPAGVAALTPLPGRTLEEDSRSQGAPRHRRGWTGQIRPGSAAGHPRSTAPNGAASPSEHFPRVPRHVQIFFPGFDLHDDAPLPESGTPVTGTGQRHRVCPAPSADVVRTSGPRSAAGACPRSHGVSHKQLATPAPPLG